MMLGSNYSVGQYLGDFVKCGTAALQVRLLSISWPLPRGAGRLGTWRCVLSNQWLLYLKSSVSMACMAAHLVLCRQLLLLQKIQLDEFVLQGWRFVFYVMAGVAGLTTLALLIFGIEPRTKYRKKTQQVSSKAQSPVKSSMRRGVNALKVSIHPVPCLLLHRLGY